MVHWNLQKSRQSWWVALEGGGVCLGIKTQMQVRNSSWVSGTVAAKILLTLRIRRGVEHDLLSKRTNRSEAMRVFKG